MLESIAERRIGEAVANGELDNLPGAGKPLELDDDALVPEELRCAYRIPEERRLRSARARAGQSDQSARVPGASGRNRCRRALPRRAQARLAENPPGKPLLR